MEKQRVRALSSYDRGLVRRMLTTQSVTSVAKHSKIDPKTVRRIRDEKENTKGTSTTTINTYVPEVIRKYQINLDLDARQKILKKIDEGVSRSELSQEFLVSESTIRRIQKKKVKLKNEFKFNKMSMVIYQKKL